MESEFPVFDNLPFKLTVIEVLMYRLKLLGEPYNAADEFFERYKSDYLKGFTFNMYLDPPEALLRKLEGRGIEINPQD